MQTMSKAEVRSLDSANLLQWLTFLSRFRAEDIGLHQDEAGNWLKGDIRPKLEDVEDELVSRGLNSRSSPCAKERDAQE